MLYLSDGDGCESTGWFDTFGEQHAIVGDDATSILCVTVAEANPRPSVVPSKTTVRASSW